MPADFHPQIAPPNMRPPVLPPGLPNRTPLEANAETKEVRVKEDPGVPPFAPPNLFEMRELDSDYESDNENDSEKKSTQNSTEPSSSDSEGAKNSDKSEDTVPKPTSVQQRILAIAGQKYDDFMKELENVHKKKEERNRLDERLAESGDNNGDRGNNNSKGNEPNAFKTPDSVHSVPPPSQKPYPIMMPNNAAPPMAPPPFSSKMPGLPPPPPPPMGKFLLSNGRCLHRKCLM